MYIFQIIIFRFLIICPKGEVIRATNRRNLHATLLRCKLKSVVGRIIIHLKHCHATKCCCCKLKKFVDKKWTPVQLATTKLFCMIIFEVGSNTCKNDSQLATQECCVEVEENKLAAR